MLASNDLVAFAAVTDLPRARVAWFTDLDGNTLSLTQFG
jgi:hypothetical protein